MSEDFGENNTVFSGNRKGSEYNTVERENSRKMTANGGGVVTILQSPGGGYYNITEPLGEGGKENQANFI